MIFKRPIKSPRFYFLDQLLIKPEELEDVDLMNITIDIIRAITVEASMDKYSIFVRPGSASELLNWLEFKPLEGFWVVDFQREVDLQVLVSSPEDKHQVIDK